jgi:hypothetical protein
LKDKVYCSTGYLFFGDICLNSGHLEEALGNLKRAEGLFQEMGMDYWLGKTKEVLGRL